MKLDFLKGYDFFTGVPDSQLKPLCDYLMATYGIGNSHIIPANEGNCVGLAAGYHLATGKIPVVYLQNSGIGNIVNPVASLMNDKVYGIPCIFIVGWRGEPGVHDEPQHIFQGEITLQLLEDVGVRTYIIGRDTTEDDVITQLKRWKPLLKNGKQVAFVVQKGALAIDENKMNYANGNTMFRMLREDVIRRVVTVSGDGLIVSTTGKTSRELFEIREKNTQGHQCDFLTVGSMGHCSSIALGIAMHKPDRKIWCIDGDGSVLMHMGAIAAIGSINPGNMVHIVINNGVHESVGGFPTVAAGLDFVKIFEGCGYANCVCVDTIDSLDAELWKAKMRSSLTFIEAKCMIGSRGDLGRPTVAAREIKEKFMENLLQS
ncbi:MAG: phosphonopyruvate decarboxylase [Oscillospiraceae bacterium]|nr:phosphonopyruvate decarboxylase [Oscillospiraceae bacterium]